MSEVKEVEVTAIVTATFPANLPANNKVYASIQLDPALSPTTQFQIPPTEAWVLEDLFVSATQTPDAILEFKANLVESKFKSAPINGLIVTNPARPKPTPVLFRPSDIVTVEAQNLANIGASAATITAYAKFRRFIGK
jgi:hypothetical protein